MKAIIKMISSKSFAVQKENGKDWKQYDCESKRDRNRLHGRLLKVLKGGGFEVVYVQ